MMREHGCAIVIPDAGEHAPGIFEVTSDFVYMRMHGQGGWLRRWLPRSGAVDMGKKCENPYRR